jgi:alkylation response protein AidB-like acyl-CoA dehydrogenase
MGNLMIKKLFKKITGLQALEDAKAQAQAEIDAANKIALQKAEELAEANRQAEIAKMTPKERATAKGEPWVSVLDTHVNKDNIRNGFFELDWNELFVLQLKQAGYGFDGDPDEEIVDRWFRDIVKNMLADEGMDPNRGAGFINVVPLTKDRSEVS